MPLSKCIVMKESELNQEAILKNDVYKICTGCVDQYIINGRNQLSGVISSFDIERVLKEKKNLDLNTIINYHPVCVMQSERFERGLVENIFEKTYNIRSIPIVNIEGEIQHIYIKVNIALEKFVEQNFLIDTDQYQVIIEQEILNLKKLYPGMRIRVLSDFKSYGMSLDKIGECCICEEEVESLDPDKDIVHLVYLYDFNCMNILGKLIDKKIKFGGSNFTGRNVDLNATPYFRIDETVKKVLEEEAYYNGNYFEPNDFGNIFQAIRMTESLNGCYVEIGTYRGDSARAALSFMEKSGIVKKAFFLDTYEGFMYEEAKNSSDCIWADTHEDTSISFVDNRLKEFLNYKLIKTNIITDELSEEIEDIAVCNIDVDMYEAVAAALEKVWKKIIPGGIIIAEDFGHTPYLYGAQYAVLEFMSAHKDKFYGMYLQSGQYYMIKK